MGHPILRARSKLINLLVLLLSTKIIKLLSHAIPRIFIVIGETHPAKA